MVLFLLAIIFHIPLRSIAPDYTIGTCIFKFSLNYMFISHFSFSHCDFRFTASGYPFVIFKLSLNETSLGHFSFSHCIAYLSWICESLLLLKNIFDIYVTEYGTALTTILPILFLYLNTVTVTAGTFEP